MSFTSAQIAIASRVFELLINGVSMPDSRDFNKGYEINIEEDELFVLNDTAPPAPNVEGEYDDEDDEEDSVSDRSDWTIKELEDHANYDLRDICETKGIKTKADKRTEKKSLTRTKMIDMILAHQEANSNEEETPKEPVTKSWVGVRFKDNTTTMTSTRIIHPED